MYKFNPTLIIIFLTTSLILTSCESGNQPSTIASQTRAPSSKQLVKPNPIKDNGLNWQKIVTVPGRFPGNTISFNVGHHTINIASNGLDRGCINILGSSPSIVAAASFGKGIMALNSIGQRFYAAKDDRTRPCNSAPIEFKGRSTTYNNTPEAVAFQNPWDSESPVQVVVANGMIYSSPITGGEISIFSIADIDFNDVLYHQGIFYAFGFDYRETAIHYYIYTSADGISWEQEIEISNEDTSRLLYNQIRYNPLLDRIDFFSAQDSTSDLATVGSISIESKVWHEESTPLSGSIQNIAYGNNLSIGVGNNGQIIRRSQDYGSHWELVKYDSSNINTLYDIAFENGIFLISGLSNDGNYITLTTELGDVYTPTNIPRFSSIASGKDYSCGINSLTQQIFCWGSGYSGELGYGESEDILLPKNVQSNIKFSSIFLGSNHACAISTDKSTYCWGYNSFGDIGDHNKSSFTPIPTKIIKNITFKSLSLGEDHSCGLTESGKIACWGANFYGELGIDNSKIISESDPIILKTEHTFLQVASGNNFSCTITTKDKKGKTQTYCWGDNQYGQLGLGQTRYDAYFKLEPLDNQFQFLFLSAGPSDHICGLDESGSAYCWGKNNSGQLGIGNTINQLKPTKLATSLKFSYIGTGLAHTCGITKDQDLYCWGDNQYGQLGLGESSSNPALTPPSLPVSIKNTSAPGNIKWVSVSVGYNNTCGTTTTGRNYCWGNNSYGQVGDNSRTGRDEPTWINANNNESQ